MRFYLYAALRCALHLPAAAAFSSEVHGGAHRLHPIPSFGKFGEIYLEPVLIQVLIRVLMEWGACKKFVQVPNLNLTLLQNQASPQ